MQLLFALALGTVAAAVTSTFPAVQGYWAFLVVGCGGLLWQWFANLG